MCAGIRNSPINIQFDTILEEKNESIPALKFFNYDNVNYTELENMPEHEGDVGLANNGGRTAVSFKEIKIHVLTLNVFLATQL